MGAVTFSIDWRLVRALQSGLPLSVFVETGTFKGDTIAEMLPHFAQLFTVELSENLWQAAVHRFIAQPKVTAARGDSASFLAQVQTSVADRSTLYWLDAHWCVGENTTGARSQCPLLAEIDAIGKLGTQSVVLIDDARLFLAPPQTPHESSQWPRFHEIVAALMRLSAQHEIMVVNDVIVFFPEAVRAPLEKYARDFGIDWLAAAAYLRDHADQQAKERTLQDLALQCLQKEHVIQELHFAVRAHERAGTIMPLARLLTRVGRRGRRVARRVKSILRPRLGYLRQYAPRELMLPKAPPSRLDPALAPTISLVTPSFQQGAYLEETLQSVLRQGYANLEYHVQDGGSTDETVAILNKYENYLAGWQSRGDGGQSHAINLGFSRTSGELMGWLNSDDLLLPGALATVAQYFSEHPSIDVVYGDRLLIDERGMEIGRWLLPGHCDRALLRADYVPQETLFWRRSLWERIGGNLDESYHFAMDWDLLIRFRNAGARFAHIPRFLGAFRVHSDQKTSAQITELGLAEMNRIRQRTLGHVPSTREIRRALRMFYLRHVAVDLAFRVRQRLGWIG
jgi:GT2 family glycosyltransferase